MSKLVSETPEQIIAEINERKGWKYLLQIASVVIFSLWLSLSYMSLNYAYKGEQLYGVIIERDWLDDSVTVLAEFPDGSFKKFYLDPEKDNNIFYSSVIYPYPKDKDIVMLSYLSEYPNTIEYAEGVLDAWIGVWIAFFLFFPAYFWSIVFLYRFLYRRRLQSLDRKAQGKMSFFEEKKRWKLLPFVITEHWVLKVQAEIPELHGTQEFVRKIRPWQINSSIEAIKSWDNFDVYYSSKNPKKYFIALPEEYLSKEEYEQEIKEFEAEWKASEENKKNK